MLSQVDLIRWSQSDYKFSNFEFSDLSYYTTLYCIFAAAYNISFKHRWIVQHT